MAKRVLVASINSAFTTISPTSHEEPVQKRLAFTSLRKNPLYCLSLQLVPTYQTCNPSFQSIQQLPQRTLTSPDEPAGNDGLDNADGNLICRVHDVLESSSSVYRILDLLGTGTFGQVFRCQKNDTKEVVAVKVVKNKPAYHTQGIVEVKVLHMLNTTYGSDRIVHLLDYFECKNHLCVVLELLSSSVLDMLQQNQFRGFPLSMVRQYTVQLLQAMVTLQDANVIHCDLKPENILLCQSAIPSELGSLDQVQASTTTTDQDATGKQDEASSHPMDVVPGQNDPSVERPGSSISTSSTAEGAAQNEVPGGTTPQWQHRMRIKVIDFGSACYEDHTMYSYIQSRFYRAPEVLLGIPYNGAIDMWSLGCVCAEMFLGLPLFPGVSQHNQLLRITEMLGTMPAAMVANSKHGAKFFKRVSSPGGGSHHQLKTPEEFAAETNTEVPTYKKYFKYTTLEDIVIKCPLPNRNRLNDKQKQQELTHRRCFLDFLHGMLRLDSWERWTPRQAIHHPFITGKHFRGPGTFQPPVDPLSNQRRFTHMVQTSAFAPLHHRPVAERTPKDNTRIRGKPSESAFGSLQAVRETADESHLQGYQYARSMPYAIQQPPPPAYLQGMQPGSYGQQGMHYPEEYFSGQSYNGSYTHSMMGPMSLGAMSYGSATGALIPDFAMALQRPDRPPFQQASPTSPYQNVFPGHNLAPQYAYSQPQMNDRTRSMSLDQSAPGFAQQPYHYPASMTYKHQAMPMQAGGYGVARSHQPYMTPVRMQTGVHHHEHSPGQWMASHQPQYMAQSLTPQHTPPKRREEEDGNEASWDPFFMEGVEEITTEEKDPEDPHDGDGDGRGKRHSGRRRRSNPQQQHPNRQKPQKARTTRDHPQQIQPKPEQDAAARARARAKSWSEP